jgi:DNA gyrase/topoisomerase IV subunit A
VHPHVRYPQLQRIALRIDTRQVRSAGRSTSGVKLLDLDPDDKVAAAMAISPKTPKPNPKTARCCNNYPTALRLTS